MAPADTDALWKLHLRGWADHCVESAAKAAAGWCCPNRSSLASAFLRPACRTGRDGGGPSSRLQGLVHFGSDPPENKTRPDPRCLHVYRAYRIARGSAETPALCPGNDQTL